MFETETIDKRAKVLVTVPNRSFIHAEVVQRLLMIIIERRYRVRIELPNFRPYENNLNHIVNIFMSCSFDFWLSIDSDNPPFNNPLDLIEWDKDIIGLPTPIWKYDETKKGENPIYWGAYKVVPEKGGYLEHYPREGLQKVDAVSSGCFLIARRVFENPEMRKTPFFREWNEDGTASKGLDLKFCEKARKHGFEIYCHYDYPCDHFTNVSLTKVMAGFKAMYEKT